jgi:hypothetical protein
MLRELWLVNLLLPLRSDNGEHVGIHGLSAELWIRRRIEVRGSTGTSRGTAQERVLRHTCETSSRRSGRGKHVHVSFTPRRMP